MNKTVVTMLIATTLFAGCKTELEPKQEPEFKYLIEQFADLKIMRYKVPGFEELSLQQKELLYYLSEAAVCGRDILYDQFYEHNLAIRKTNEAIIESYKGDRNTPEFEKFMVYAKRVWFSNGVHHHYSTDKFYPEVSQDFFIDLIEKSDVALLPLAINETIGDFAKRITTIIYNDKTDTKRVVLDDSLDIVAESACNFYKNLTLEEVEAYNAKFKHPDPNRPLSLGLNSQLEKVNGQIQENVYKIDGLYGKAIEKIVYWLEKAQQVAENDHQKKYIGLLIQYYKSGSLQTFDDYCVSWVQDSVSQVDFVNGFTEVYGDPLGMKATWESIVNFKNIEATKRTQIISENAQWFEDNAPIDPRFRKPVVKGVSAKVITVAQLGGDCYPSTPIGINLPNADWIRRDYGSKSVTIENITEAYDKASEGNGFLQEFAASEEEIALSKKHGSLASNLHTDLHECLGHGSGQLLPGTSSEALKNYSSTLEEARADLFALYYLGHPKTVELGLIESFDVAKTEYNGFLRNGLLTQLTRIEPGKNIEESHMRNRQLIAKWCLEKGQSDKVVEMVQRDGKTYVVINDYQKLNALFGQLLAEIQRIKSEGDFLAGKNLVENYAVKVDSTLHNEVLARFKKLNIAPYGGFVNPVFKPIYEGDKLIDIKLDYTETYTDQMMRYSKQYSFL